MTAVNGAPAADALRELVREVLRDVLPALAAGNGSPAVATSPVSAPAPATRPAPATPPTSDPAPSVSAGTPRAAGPAGITDGAYETPAGVKLQAVRVATDEELHAFVLQVVRLADNPKRRRDLLAGRLRFTLGDAGSGAVPHPPAPANGRSSQIAASGADQRIERGAVTERAVQAAADSGARLVLGPRAVLTPLARDRARALGVPIEKER
jgi:hypothetical protein